MAWAAVRSKAVVLLLLICWLVCPLVVGVLCLSLFCCALHYVLSSFAIISKRKRTGYVAYIVLRMSCYCKYPLMTLPRDAGVGLRCVIVVFPEHTYFLSTRPVNI